MILVLTNEEKFAKWLGDGKVELIEATKTVSADKLTTTVVTRTEEELISKGFQKFTVKHVGKPEKGYRPVETWSLDNDKLIKTITWTQIEK